MKPKKKKAEPGSTPAAKPAPAPIGLAPLEKSAWWVNNPNPKAKLRLFCLMGIGNVASTYGSWVSAETAASYPDIEVCIVELPGHGTNLSSSPLDKLDAAVDALAAEIQRCHGSAPFAFFGFSMGANIMYLLAQRLPGCRKLYVAGRGPPHLKAPARDEQAPQVAKCMAVADEGDAEAVVQVLEADVLPRFMGEAQVTSYGRLLRSRLVREEGRKDVLRFARSLAADCAIGMEANEVPRNLACDLAFFYSPADETWPQRVSGLYEDFPELWRSYCPSNTFTSEEVAPVSHNDLGGFGSPVFPKICADLSSLVSRD